MSIASLVSMLVAAGMSRCLVQAQSLDNNEMIGADEFWCNQDYYGVDLGGWSCDDSVIDRGWCTSCTSTASFMQTTAVN